MDLTPEILDDKIKSDPSIALLNIALEELTEDSPISKYNYGKACYRLAKIHYDKADLDEAEKFFKIALQCAESPGDIFSLFKILGFLIRISSEKLDDEGAQTFIQQTEALIQQLGSMLDSLNAEYFYNLGVVKTYKGEFKEAKENYLFAYLKSKEENERDLLAKCLLSLATNAYNTKDFEGALDYVNQLAELLSIINKSYLKGSMHLLTGKIYSELGYFEKSVEYFAMANQFLQEKKSWNLLGYVLLGRGIVSKRRGNFDKALTFFEMANEMVGTGNFRRLRNLIEREIQDVNDSSVDIYLDKTNRKVFERSLGAIDFKHRFVLLEILFLLAKNSGSYYDKEDLAKSIWKDEYNPLMHDKLIYTSVSRLRKLIEPKNTKGEKRKYIIRGKDGYTFNPDVKIRFHMENKPAQEPTIANVELSSPV